MSDITYLLSLDSLINGLRLTLMLHMRSGILFFAAGNCLNFMSFAYAAQVRYDLLKNKFSLACSNNVVHMGKS